MALYVDEPTDLHVGEYQGRRYTWLDTRWIHSETGLVAAEAIARVLDRQRSQKVAALQLGKHISDSASRQQWFDYLRVELRTSLKELVHLGFFKEVFVRDPIAALIAHYDALPASTARSIYNCVNLRDRFFENRSPRSFAFTVQLMGEGPFLRSDFHDFCLSQEVALSRHDEQTHALVIGRDGWTHRGVDALLESTQGSVCRVYSQEMFVAVLAGEPDPFETWPMPDRLTQLYAFRARHPALEYISQGWAGWVTGFRSSHTPNALSLSQTWNSLSESPLYMMGYRVGLSGLEAVERRQVLAAAFQEPIPYVGDDAYMERWGQPQTGSRLKRIAEQLAHNIDSHRKQRSHEVAVQEWQEDLNWLEDTFYSGVFRFAWPYAHYDSGTRPRYAK